MQRLGKQICYLRTRLGLSQGRLAELVQLSSRTINDIEQGRGNPSLDTLTRIAVCLNAEPWEMLLGVSAVPPVATEDMEPQHIH
jgi:transcriptional regulator with XRE-family HTH domain